MVNSRAIMPSPDEMVKIEGYVEDITNYVGVPSTIVKGIIWQESKFDPKSYRYNYDNVYDRSYGLMHLSLPTALWIANIVTNNAYKTITPDDLYDPIMNIWLGSEYLLRLYQKYNNWNDAIAAYNAGSVKHLNSGNYINQAYVNNVVRVSQILKSPVTPFSTIKSM